MRSHGCYITQIEINRKVMTVTDMKRRLNQFRNECHRENLCNQYEGNRNQEGLGTEKERKRGVRERGVREGSEKEGSEREGE